MLIKTTRGRRLAVLLILGFFVLSLLPVLDAQAAEYIEVVTEVPDGVQPIATLEQRKAIELWHYSGGYWKATVDGSTVQFSDVQVQDGLANLSALVGKAIDMTFDIPSEVTAAVAAGKKISVACTSEKTELFEGTPAFKIENGKLYFKAEPVFHFVADYRYVDFFSSLTKFIPFVEPDYGYNVYSIYKGSTNVGGAKGYFNPNNPTELGAPGTIHPTQIVGSSGKLKPGFTVTETYGTEYKSEDVTIGHGTFSNAGAVGLVFVYPLTFTFFEDGNPPPPPPPEPEEEKEPPIPTTNDEVDLASNIVGPLEAKACEKTVSVKVQAMNLGKGKQTSTVTFTVQGRTQTKDVTLNEGEQKELTFTFEAPCTGGSVGMTSNIDPQKKLKDRDWNNNKSQKNLKIQYEEPEPVANCELAKIDWSETEEHTYSYQDVEWRFNGFTFVPQTVTKSAVCQHIHNYRAELKADPIKFTYQDKETHLMKSGYGYYIEAVTKIEVEEVSDVGVCGKARKMEHKEKVKPPAQARYYAPSTAKPQKVTNRLGTQAATVDLKSDNKTPDRTFTTPVNKISELKNKLIYTDPNWADGRHFFDIRFQGGGVAGKEWCYQRKGSIENGQYVDIKGNMYEDDHTG